jgi:hypothetical protein
MHLWEYRPIDIAFFFENGRRKGDDGKIKAWREVTPQPIVEVYKPIYTTLETIVSGELKEEIQRLKNEIAATDNASSQTDTSY